MYVGGGGWVTYYLNLIKLGGNSAPVRDADLSYLALEDKFVEYFVKYAEVLQQVCRHLKNLSTLN